MRKVAIGFVLGWAAAFIPRLIGSKFEGPIVKRIILKYGPIAHSASRGALRSIATRGTWSGISDDKRARILEEEADA
jgi:hypothetical protein